MRKIRYKKPSSKLSKMSAPTGESNNRASVGMDKFVGEYFFISVDKLIPFKNQARIAFNKDQLEKLAGTIKEHGIRQPLTVIKSSEAEGKYEVVSGERRLRAAKIAGLEKVPCIILDTQAKSDEIAIIENIQRSDLHPIELARALKKLVDVYGWGGQLELERKLGISASKISELLKYLSWDKEIQELLISNNISTRENLRRLSKLPHDEKRKEVILKMTTQNLGQKNLSLFRVNLKDSKINVYKGGLKSLTHETKRELIKELESFLYELQHNNF